MVWKWVVAGCTAIALAGCDTGPVYAPIPDQNRPGQVGPRQSSQAIARSFVEVVRTVEPVAERECRARTRGVNCDFRIVVDDRPDQPPNAFQTLDKSGRPIIAFTLALIADARNRDELAFVLGHEAAHHVRGHIERQQQNAVAGAVIAGSLAVLLGGGADAVEAAQRNGAMVGARSYSKDFELEADALGTIITVRAGYDPVRGAEFFTRIPDPGNRLQHPRTTRRLERTGASSRS